MNEPQDFIGLIIALMAAITSKEIAHLVGPYAAIFVLALAGAGLSLNSNEKIISPFASVWYITMRVLVALVLTVSVAEALQKVVPAIAPRYTIAPIAFLIGFINDYSAVRKWIGEKVSAITDIFIKKQGNG